MKGPYEKYYDTDRTRKTCLGVNGVVAAIQRGQHDDAEHHSSDITNEVVLHLAMRVAGKVGREDIPADETISANLMLRCVLLSSD